MCAWTPRRRAETRRSWAVWLDLGGAWGQRGPMFPIRDHNPSGRTPYVTYALIVINVLVFISYWPLFADDNALNRLFFNWAMVPAIISDGGHYHTFLTSMFMHGGLMHIAGNMLFLWIFGDNLEDEMGHLPYLAFYLLSGLAAGFAHYISNTYSPVPTVGASGAIAGVMGGYLLLFPKARVDIILILIIFIRIFPVPAWVMLGLWFGMQIFSGVTVDASMGGVAYWAHAGGFVVGIVLALPVFLRRGGTEFWQRNQGHPPHPEADYSLGHSRIPVIKRRK